MYGDTETLRKRADQLREQGVDIRARADQLVTQTEAIGWTGRAADALRLRIRERATHLRKAAGQHETAAAALDRHLHEVDAVKDSIGDIERKATSIVAEARTRVARVEAANDASDTGAADVRRVPDADDLTLADFTPPPAGHQDWLTVTLPGL